jgi:ABC-2 type transport system ATP-binding protein
MMGIVPESESPPTFLTVEETLHLVGRIREVNNLEKVTENWLNFFKLEEQRNTLCRDLSKGQRQKLMLASALIHGPRLLILDEPFINLDPIYQKKLRDYLLEYSINGGTVFLCTHLLDTAEKLVNRVAFLNKGRIIASGALNDIKQVDEHLEDAFIRLVKDV